MFSRKHSFRRIFSVSVFIAFLVNVFPVHALGLILNFDNDMWAGDSDWSNISNWAEGVLPDAWDDVILTAGVDSNSGPAVHVASLSFTGNGHLNIPVIVDGGATFSQDASLGNAGVIIGDVTFVDNAFNDGIVSGLATFNDSAANYGTLMSDAVFNGSNINQGIISGNAIFRDSSFNVIGSVISGNADFYDVSYNEGTVSGTAKFHMYTAVGSEVSISGDTNFHGTGIVAGSILDSADAPITSWQLTNGSKLNNGFLQGDIFLSDMSQNFGTVSGNAVFQNSADNSGGVVQWNATFQNNSYNGGIVLSNAIFFDTSRNQWTVNGDATYMLYTAVSWVVTVSGDTSFYGTGSVVWRIYDAFSSAIHNWVLDSGTILSGTLKGDAIFHDTSINNGIVEGSGTFQDLSINNGTILGDGYFASATNNAMGAIVIGSINPLPLIVSWGGGGGGGWSSGGGGGSSPAFAGGPTISNTPDNNDDVNSSGNDDEEDEDGVPINDDDEELICVAPLDSGKWYRTCGMVADETTGGFTPFYENMECEGVFTRNEGTDFKARQEVVGVALKMRKKNENVVFVSPTAYRNIFTDVSLSSFYLPVIETALHEGLITDDITLFEPTRSTTRAEAYAMIMTSVCMVNQVNSVSEANTWWTWFTVQNENNASWQRNVHDAAFKNGLTNKQWNDFLPDESIQARELHVLTARAADWAETTGGCNPKPLECN